MVDVHRRRQQLVENDAEPNIVDLLYLAEHCCPHNTSIKRCLASATITRRGLFGGCNCGELNGCLSRPVRRNTVCTYHRHASTNISQYKYVVIVKSQAIYFRDFGSRKTSFDKSHPDRSLKVIDTQFLSRVSILARNIDIANLSVRPSIRPSICLSVTFRYQMKTA